MPASDDATAVQAAVRASVAATIDLVADGPDRFRVLTPFRLDDGDHLCIVLRRHRDCWEFADEGHTRMAAGMDETGFGLAGDKIDEIIDASAASFDVVARDGELVHAIEKGNFGTGLAAFVQAQLRVNDQLCRALARSADSERNERS